MIGKSNVFYGPHVDIQGVLIRWDNHTCVISAISQLWVGKPNDRKWGMTIESEDEGLNIELKSGSVHSFISGSHDFLMEAYDLMCKVTAEGRSEEQYTVDFENNSLKKHEEPKEEQEEETPAPQTPLVNPAISSPKEELLILKEHYKKGKNAEPIILQLLDEIAACYDGNNAKDLQELYKSFIQLSLVNDCNELGLNRLIEEVKIRIYS